MASLILALAALVIAAVAGWFAWCALVNSSEALNAALMANYPEPDALFVTDDGEEIELTFDRGQRN